MTAHLKPLGRLVPPDRRHEELYPASLVELPTKVPVPVGTNWYEGMDNPVKGADGKYRVKATNLGSVRGGHCYCHEPVGEPDTEANHAFYDQAQEGACEGFGHGRAMDLLGHGRIDAFWLYDDARRIDGDYPDGEGSLNRSACAALKKWGCHPELAESPNVPGVIARVPWREGVKSVGIKSYHWTASVDEIVKALGYPTSVTEIPMLNSWGRDGYPHRVFFPLELVARLQSEEGEASVLVPR